jgi:Photosynthesis system II assembly factor YCF48
MTKVPKIVVARLAEHAIMNALEIHPDANLLAAFGEQSLGAPDRLHVMEHLTQCLECREVVALAGPEQIRETLLPQPAASRRFSWPVLRWGAAVACIVVVGAAVSLHQRESHRESALQELQVRSQNGGPNSRPSPARQNSSASAAAINLQGDIRQASASGQLEGTRALMPSPREAQVTGAAALNQTEAVGSQDTTDVADIGNIDNLVPGRAKEPLDEPEAPVSNGAIGGDLTSARQTALATLLAASPNLVPRWALTSDGSLQRSLDSGRSWDVIPISTQSHFHALAANGLDIWVGGAAGSLYRSSDAGQHWTQIQPTDSGQSLAADIIGVEFPDMQHGRVNTSTGEVWVTEDAGFTWKKQ